MNTFYEFAAQAFNGLIYLLGIGTFTLIIIRCASIAYCRAKRSQRRKRKAAAQRQENKRRVKTLERDRIFWNVERICRLEMRIEEAERIDAARVQTITLKGVMAKEPDAPDVLGTNCRFIRG